MRKTRQLHRLLGLLLLLPLFGWALTGLVFFIKPGYEGAYEQLAVKSYPLSQATVISPEPHWQQVRLIRTVLGEHLLVQSQGRWRHLQPGSQSPAALPDETQLRLLLQDAMAANPARYGNITALAGNRAHTSTGVSISLDWDTLSLRQEGNDTRLINRLYRVHYLQWLPSGVLNRWLGILGLLLLLTMALVGLRLCFRRPPDTSFKG
ncbi:PepSY domain-containing protein [Zobellella maritima]|uniref:PepSY domain-containing protein n=1 Tax=Zobellella maritima TaxID=2059725 RepID=UPI000E307DC0|nr:PepSY domain-containing protein [Zobellella maritima]